MRIIGYILVMLGGLALACHSCIEVARKDGEANSVQQVLERTDVRLVPPVVSGIMVVGGLLLLASADQRDED
jgi:hypothetical protein